MPDNARFLWEFVRDPLHTAAVAPSSRGLAAAMTIDLPVHGEPNVVELGAGTGALTAAIQRTLAGRGRHIAFERHPRWAKLLQQRYPGVHVINADVADLTDVLTEHSITQADAVVSGLPWAAYRAPLPAMLAAALAPCGVLTQFAYTWSRWAPPARAELAMLRQHFAQVDISPTIWLNLPPAVVYRARRPITAQPR